MSTNMTRRSTTMMKTNEDNLYRPSAVIIRCLLHHLMSFSYLPYPTYELVSFVDVTSSAIQLIFGYKYKSDARSPAH